MTSLNGEKHFDHCDELALYAAKRQVVDDHAHQVKYETPMTPESERKPEPITVPAPEHGTAKKSKKEKEKAAKEARAAAEAAAATVEPTVTATTTTTTTTATTNVAPVVRKVSKPLITIDIDDDMPRPSPDPDEIRLRQMLGITDEVESYFASTVKFVNMRTGEEEQEHEAYYRHEIWKWMITSLSKGEFRAIGKSVEPAYDIRRYHRRILEAANKSTILTYVTEYRKMFELPPKGTDIFQYQLDLQEQIARVRSIAKEIPESLEKCMLLFVASSMAAHKETALKHLDKRQGLHN